MSYKNSRDKVLKLWNSISQDKKKTAIHSLGLLFGEYRHMLTYTNRKGAYKGNPVFDNNMRVENLDFWADIELQNYPALSEKMEDTFKNAANEWYLKQFPHLVR